MLPSKTEAQIAVHVQHFLRKVERAAKDIDVVEYIKGKPENFFVGRWFSALGDETGVHSHKHEHTAVLTPAKLEARHKRRLPESDIPHDLSLPGIADVSWSSPAPPPVPAVGTKSADIDNVVRELTKGTRKERRKPKEKARNHPPKEAQKKAAVDREEEKAPPVQFQSPVPAPEQEQPQSQPAAVSVPVPPPAQSQPQTQFMQGPAAAYPMMPGNAMGYAAPAQYSTTQTKLMEIMRELGSLTQGLEAEQPNCRPLLETDAQFRYYWEALQSCSVSLQHVVSDIYYIHLNTPPVQPQYMYQQMYYAPEHARPAPAGYMQYYTDKPQNAEYS